MTDKPDGRKYDVGEEVDFTDDDGKVVPGVVHAVRYQVGRYELVGAHHEDMFDKTSRIVPGTGQMQLVPGTENERHSFEYIMVHKHQHKAWWATKNSNEEKHSKNLENIKNYHATRKAAKPEEREKVPLPKERGSLEELPPLKQHLRVFEED